MALIKVSANDEDDGGGRRRGQTFDLGPSIIHDCCCCCCCLFSVYFSVVVVCETILYMDGVLILTEAIIIIELMIF